MYDGSSQLVFLATHKFTGKERDSESGLDNFGARYDSSSIGRFMSPDPSMDSAVLRNPQSWNRYSYTINNPLRYIDPDGEVWAPTSDTSNPYTWFDRCPANTNCLDEVATQVGEQVWVYGPMAATDLKKIDTNDNGYIDLRDVASASGAYFEFQAGVSATYASPQTAADLYNAAFDVHKLYPDAGKLSLNDAGIANGNGFDPHETHDLGRSADMRYMDENGKPVNSVTKADDDRMRNIVRIFKENGFNQNYSDNDRALGTFWAKNHVNHIHFGKSIGVGRCEIGLSSCR